MAIQLNDFTDTKRVEVEGECKKISTWAFENPSYCVPGECEPKLTLIFEDGTKKKAKELPKRENC